MTQIDSLKYRIGAEWLPGEADAEALDLNPADQRQALIRYRLASSAQVHRAMDAAAEGFAVWRAATPVARAAVLSGAARRLRERQEAIAAVVSRENGKTLAEARVEVEKSADFLDFYAATARLPQGGMIADGRTGTRGMVLVEPIGIVAMITPWNDPMLTPARKLGPALISGNAVVLKPARDTPLAAWHLTQALIEAGLPDGVLNMLMTDHASFDAAVLSDPRLAAVTFTGSTSVGLELGRRLGGRNVRLQTEMGGKNASVVLADADLDMAVSTIVAASFGQAGQRCTATSRVIVEAPVYSEVVRRLGEAVAALRIGPGDDAATQVGPLVSARQREDVLGHLARVRESGGRVITGGGVPEGETYAQGCYVQPTVVADVTSEMPIWRDEVFGPVLAVRPVASFEQALDAVNDSEYGLSAALFTNSLRYANRFIDGAEAGQVSINLPTSGWDVHQPFGGFKASGSAFKEQGLEGLRFYTRSKMTATRFDW